MSQSLGKEYIKFVSQNILGMLGISIYILADTFYISKAAGADGITVLNLCLPLYNLIYAIGSMVGVGSATRFTILKAQGDLVCHRFFSNAIFSVLFLITGCLIAGYQVSYNNLLEKEKAIELTKNEKNDSIQTRRSSAKGESVSDDAYYLKELHGYVAVYLQDGTTLYETTSLSVNNLPDEVQQNLKNGIYLKSAEELYGFLENYSS